MNLDASYFYCALIRSLRLSYFDSNGKRIVPEYGGTVVAHPEFDPKVIAHMDRVLPRATANRVYSRAFAACKSKADAMLDQFEERSCLGYKKASRFKNAVDRFAAFAGPESAKILRQFSK